MFYFIQVETQLLLTRIETEATLLCEELVARTSNFGDLLAEVKSAFPFQGAILNQTTLTGIPDWYDLNGTLHDRFTLHRHNAILTLLVVPKPCCYSGELFLL